MIYINQCRVNNVVTRFFDKRQRTDTFFIWVITNPITNVKIKYIVKDTSTRPQSYNLFEFIHSFACVEDYSYVKDEYFEFDYIVDEENPTICIESGHNYYSVYETTEFSLDPQYIIGCPIEKDIMFVEIKRDVNTDKSHSGDVYY